MAPWHGEALWQDEAPWQDETAGLVILPDGRRVRGRGLRNALPAADELPEFGLYLTGKPYAADRWASRWVRWPDFRLPHDKWDAIEAIFEAHDRAAGERARAVCAVWPAGAPPPTSRAQAACRPSSSMPNRPPGLPTALPASLAAAAA